MTGVVNKTNKNVTNKRRYVICFCLRCRKLLVPLGCLSIDDVEDNVRRIINEFDIHIIEKGIKL